MFCRFGFDDDSRPVAATAWLKDVWIRPSPRIDQPRQRFEVRRVQLVQLAPIEQRVDDRMVPQLLQHARVGRQLPLRRALPGRQPQLLVQDHAELRRRVQVELLAGASEDLGLELCHPVADVSAHLLQVGDVEGHAPRLHAREHRGERQLDRLEQFAEALLVDLLLHHRRQQRDRRRLGRDAHAIPRR